MRKAIDDLIEKHDDSRILMFWGRVVKVMIGLCIVLAFSLGWNILQWQQNKSQDRRIAKEDGAIAAIRSADTVAKLAAYRTCVTNLPRASDLFNGLVTFFDSEAQALKHLRDSIPKGNSAYAARDHLYKNNKAIANDLRAFLPIKCVLTKSGHSRG